MPTIPIYIRKEDYAKFLEKYSPEWMHEVLNDREAVVQHAVEHVAQTMPAYAQPATPHPSEELPCCKNRQPCKHWLWDGLKSTYTNTISGRVVEVTA